MTQLWIPPQLRPFREARLVALCLGALSIAALAEHLTELPPTPTSATMLPKAASPSGAPSPVPDWPHAPTAAMSRAQIEAVVDRLTSFDIRDQDLISPFAPLDAVSPPAATSNSVKYVTPPALRDVETLGPQALPALIKHLGDARPTSAPRSFGGGFYGTDPFRFEVRPWDRVSNVDALDQSGSYATTTPQTVGAACYIAIGQIVNRDYVGTSIVPTPGLAQLVREEWGGTTSEGVQQSLLADVYSRPSRLRTTYYFHGYRYTVPWHSGALQRLCYYDPDDGERAAVALLRRPICDPTLADEFVRTELVDLPVVRPAVLRRRVNRFVTANGPCYRDYVYAALNMDYNRLYWLGHDLEVRRGRQLQALLYPHRSQAHPTFLNATDIMDDDDVILELQPFHSRHVEAAVDSLLREITRRLRSPHDIRDGSATVEDPADFVACGQDCKAYLRGPGYEADRRAFDSAAKDLASKLLHTTAPGESGIDVWSDWIRQTREVREEQW